MAWSYSSPSLGSLATPTASYIKGLLDNLHADDAVWGADVNGGAHTLSNVAISATSVSVSGTSSAQYLQGQTLIVDPGSGAGKLTLGGSGSADDTIYAEFFNRDSSASAAGVYVTGRFGADMPIYEVRATQSTYTGTLACSSKLTITGSGSGTSGLKLTRTGGSHAWYVLQGLDETLYATYDGSTVYSFTSAGVATKPSTSTWAIASDGRTKRNVAPFSDGLAAIKVLNPVNYEYNGKAGTPDGVKGIGLIAQDAGSIPYCIETRRGKLTPSEPETDILNINYHALFLVLVNAVKELDARLTAAGL